VCELDLAAALQPMNLSFFFISTVYQRLTLLLGNHANICAQNVHHGIPRSIPFPLFHKVA
jgi:hypothetical protein